MRDLSMSPETELAGRLVGNALKVFSDGRAVVRGNKTNSGRRLVKGVGGPKVVIV